MSRSVMRHSCLLIVVSWTMIQAGCYEAAPADDSTTRLAVETSPISEAFPVDTVQVASELEPAEETARSPPPVEKVATTELVSESIHRSSSHVRNVMLIIGDGMGPQRFHTSTPVPLIFMGPESTTERFNGLLHSTDVGKATIAIVRGEQPFDAYSVSLHLW